VKLRVSHSTLLVTWDDGSPAYGHAVPPPLWAFVLAEVERVGLTADYRRAYDAGNAKVQEARSDRRHTILDEHEAEESLFQRVVERVYGPQTLWPWQRGWTQEIADAYPVANRAAKEAA
jgi:hypothetical protein